MNDCCRTTHTHTHTHIYIYIYIYIWPRRPGFNPGKVIPKTQKIVLDATLLNTQHYKVRIKG